MKRKIIIDKLNNILLEVGMIIGELKYEESHIINNDIVKFKEVTRTSKQANQNLNLKGDDELPYLKEGTLRKVKRGNSYIWEARYYDENKIQKSVFSKNQKTCIDKLNNEIVERDKILKTHDESRYVTKNITVSMWIRKYLELYKKPYISSERLKSITRTLEIHVIPKIGNKKLKDITLEILQDLINNIKIVDNKKTAGSRTRVEVYQILLNIFEMAKNTNVIKNNIMQLIRKPIHKKIKGKALTIDEQVAFFDSIKTHSLRFLLLFYIFTGARRSEALKIKWTDIDYHKNHIHVKGTKTDNADRIFPLYNCVKELFDNIPKNGEYVFNFNADYVTRSFKKIVNNHKLHDLRYTFITRCGEKGINTKAIAKIVGHADDNITKNLYFSALSDFINAESEKMQDLFSYDYKDTDFDT